MTFKGNFSENAYTTRDNCRVCNSKNMSELFSLGNLYISNFVEKGETGPRAPLDMTFCNNCSLVQLKHTAPQELLYAGFYWYKSGVTDTMKEALRDITKKAEERFHLERGDVVLDIGSNDGTLLRTYQTPGIIKVGVEPAKNFKEEGTQGLDYFINDFWTLENYNKYLKKKSKITTAIGMFYDMEDPNQFVSDAARSLRKDGVFIAQLMCLKNMIDANDVGNICHEHLEYYSFNSLEYLLNINGLEIFDIEKNNVNGGSYRVYSRLDGSKVSFDGGKERVDAVRQEEKDICNKKTFADFYQRLEKNKKQCVEFIRKENNLGKKTWVYGASTKGNTILQYYGLTDKDIVAASDRTPSKWGKYTIGTNIPIVSEEDARRANPDYFLVLPYTFINEFYEREKGWREKGGKFIVPLPEFKVLD
ncbi:MAG: class I SAM-dependent methyltransferase [Candidatus Nanoarchaeia archaeon]